MTDRTRIGAVAYLNTRPLVLGMEQGLGADRIDLSYDVPAVLAERTAAGELDIALLPVIALAGAPDLEIVPGLSISTHGPCRSVLLVSRVPVDEVRTVALDPESRTSNVLVQVLFDQVWGGHPDFSPGPNDCDAALSTHDAVVRIGDKALFEPVPHGTRVYDLGETWTQATGLPFVFAVWAARPESIDRELYQILHDSRRSGVKQVDLIAEDYTWNGHRDPALSAAYLRKHIQYRLGSPELEALGKFFGHAHDLGLIEHRPEIRLALQRWTQCHETASTHGSLTLKAKKGT